MAGRTEISPVLPMAVARDTPKMIANDRFGSTTGKEDETDI